MVSSAGVFFLNTPGVAGSHSSTPKGRGCRSSNRNGASTSWICAARPWKSSKKKGWPSGQLQAVWASICNHWAVANRNACTTGWGRGGWPSDAGWLGDDVV
eukprot:1611813-Amphidinium_carterae.1